MSKELTRTIIIRVYTHNLTLGRHAAHCCLMSHNIQRNPLICFALPHCLCRALLTQRTATRVYRIIGVPTD